MAKHYFNSDVENINFAETINGAKEINRWVEKQTDKKIQNLISPDDLSKDSAAVLINATCFKGTWLNTFKDLI